RALAHRIRGTDIDVGIDLRTHLGLGFRIDPDVRARIGVGAHSDSPSTGRLNSRNFVPPPAYSTLVTSSQPAAPSSFNSAFGSLVSFCVGPRGGRNVSYSHSVIGR